MFRNLQFIDLQRKTSDSCHIDSCRFNEEVNVVLFRRISVLIRKFFVFTGLFFLTGIACAFETCNEYSVRVTTHPIPMQFSGALARWDEIRNNLDSSAESIIIGDSLAEAWPDYMFRGLFDGDAVQNLGVARDRIQNILWRLDDTGLNKIKPKRIIIVAGTNNLSDENLDPCAIIIGLKYIVKKARYIWPMAEVYLFPIMPRGSDFGFRNESRKIINAALAEWRYEKFKFINVNEIELTCNMITMADEHDLKYIKNFPVCDKYRVDNLHLTEAGYKFLGASLTGIK